MAKMRTISEIRDRGGHLSPASNVPTQSEAETMSIPEQGGQPAAEETPKEEPYSCSLYPDMDTESNPDPELIDDHDNEIEDGIVTVIGGTTTTRPSLFQQAPLGNLNSSSNPLEETKENLEPGLLFRIPKIGGMSAVGNRNAPPPAPIGSLSGNIMPQVAPAVAGDILKFVEDPSFNYVDFARRISGSKGTFQSRRQQGSDRGTMSKFRWPGGTLQHTSNPGLFLGWPGIQPREPTVPRCRIVVGRKIQDRVQHDVLYVSSVQCYVTFVTN